MFAPIADEDRRLFTAADLANFEWDEQTLTGIKIVSLTKLKLYGKEPGYSSPVPLTDLYLGKYAPRDNPYRFGYGVKRKPKASGHQVKIRQRRKKRSSVPAFSLTSEVEGVGGAEATCA